MPLITWSEHFRLNAERSIIHDSADDLRLTPDERARVAYSIAEFQSGESSEGNDYRAKSAAFAERVGDDEFRLAADRFIAEENGHAALLERIMIANDIPHATTSWTDGVFRWVRARDEVAWSSRVLLCAELLAQLFYPALRDATRSPYLVEVCERIIEDEEQHITFQVERIGRVDASLALFRRTLQRSAQAGLFAGTVAVVWWEHRRVLRTRYNVATYAREAIARFRDATARIEAARRRWAAAPRVTGAEQPRPTG